MTSPVPNAADVGNSRALQHGARASDANLVHLDDTRQALFDWLAATAPVREAGQLPQADMPAVEDCARAWARVRQIDDWVSKHGPLDKRGRPRPALQALERASKNLTEKLAQLGMTPRARVSLGVDLVRTVDLATAMSEKDPERRRALLAELGLGDDA